MFFFCFNIISNKFKYLFSIKRKIKEYRSHLKKKSSLLLFLLLINSQTTSKKIKDRTKNGRHSSSNPDKILFDISSTILES